MIKEYSKTKRFSTQILIQALLFIQILSPFAHAMRAPQRGDDQAGVEEIRRSLQEPQPVLTAGTEERYRIDWKKMTTIKNGHAQPLIEGDRLLLADFGEQTYLLQVAGGRVRVMELSKDENYEFQPEDHHFPSVLKTAPYAMFRESPQVRISFGFSHTSELRNLSLFDLLIERTADGISFKFEDKRTVRDDDDKDSNERFAVMLVPVAPLTAGAEGLPPEADPLSQAYNPSQREIATPVDRAVPPTFAGKDLDSPDVVRALMDALEAGYQENGQGHVSVLYPVDRVAGWRDRAKREGRLWEEIPPGVREPLQTLYDYRYDLLERPVGTLDNATISLVVGSLNSPQQAVADAARDVIMAARARGLNGTLSQIAQEYQRRSGRFGSYARLSYWDALTTFIDPAFPGELGNPYRPLFDEHSLSPEAVHEALQFLFDPNSKKSWLKSFSGIRGPFTKAMIDAAMRRNADGELRGFPVTDLQTDAATQLHDAAKVAVAHIVREFVRFALPMMAEKEKWQGWEGGRKVSGPPRGGILMDPRDTGPAVSQVVARTLLKLGVEVEFAGIGSAPEAAARALLSQGQVDFVIFVSSSHVQQGTNGFKLMLKSGQILPVSEARAFIKHFITKAKDLENTRELIGLLSDPPDSSLNDRIAEIQRGMPQAYLESKRLYGAYGDSVLAGVPMSEQSRVEQRKRAIREQLARLKVIFLYDANGGSGVTDLAFLRSWAPFLITVNDRIRLFSHDLAPWEGSTAQAKAIAKKLEPELARRGYTLMVFGTDTDRDRRFMLPRNPHTREYYYPGPQALFSIDAVYHALMNAGKKPAVVGNDPTTARMELLAGAMGFRFEKGEVGEANVVAVLLRLVALGYKTMGGEGSNASTFGDEVLVRDLLLALGSAFAFMGDPEMTRTLIRQVARPEEQEPLLAQVDEWYRPENLPDLFYHILEDVLPPEAVTDTFDPTEARRGTGTPATQAEITASVSRQKRYKDALDRVVEREFLPVALPGIARIVAEVSGEPVAPSQIGYRIANYEGTERLEGFGNRKGHEGGYLLELTYTDRKGDPHFLGWVWTRESQTEMGVARRIVDMVSDFLPREKGRRLVKELYAFLYPKWNHTLDQAEMRAMESLLEELSPEDEAIRQLSRQAEETRGNNLEVRHDQESKYANPAKPESRSPNVETNLNSELKEIEGALAEMRDLTRRLALPLAEIQQIAGEVQQSGQIAAEQSYRIEQQLDRLRQATKPSPVAGGPLSGDSELELFGRILVLESARWLISRSESSLGEPSASTPKMLMEWVGRVAVIAGQLSQIAQRDSAHYPQAHLVAADIHLAEQGLLGAAVRAREPAVPVETDPLNALALQPPLDVILSDLDETAAADRNSDIEVRTATLIRRFVRLGGEFGFLSTRDREDIEKRGRVSDILQGLPPAVQQRLRIFDRSGVTHPVVWPLVAGRTHLVSRERLLAAAGAVWPEAKEATEGNKEPATIQDPKNRKHVAYQFGKLTVYVPKPNTPPQAMFSFRHAKDNLGMSQDEIDQELPRLRKALVKSGLFPQDVDLNFGGSTTINVELAGKGHFIRLAYLDNPEYREKRIGVVDDEGKADTSGRRALEIADPRVVPIHVDRTKDDGTLPPHVIRSQLQKQKALNRLLEIEIAKREAALREAPAGAEQIPLDEAAAAKNLVILTPDMVEIGIPSLARLQGSSGAQDVLFAAIVNDRSQAAQVRRLLEQHQLQLAEPLVILSGKKWSLDQAIEYLEAEARRKDLEPKTIQKFEQLRDLGRLLVPADYQQMWNERVNQQAGLEIQM